MVDKERTRQIWAFFALTLFGVFLLYMLRQFIVSFLGAVIFYVLFKPLMLRMLKRKWNRALAAFFIILISFLIVIVPTFFLSYMLYMKTGEIANDITVTNLLKNGDKYGFITPDMLDQFKKEAAGLIPDLINTIFLIVAQLGVMYFLLFYLLIHNVKIEARVRDMLPFRKRNTEILYDELVSQTYSNAFSIPFLAFLQGATAALGFWIFGVEEPVFWGMLCGFASIVPIIGTTLVWLPVAIYLALYVKVWTGAGMFLYGGLVIINIDNVCRMILQKKFAEVHPVITLMGVIVGISLFGLPGIIFGPLLISYFIIFYQLYRSEYFDAEEVI